MEQFLSEMDPFRVGSAPIISNWREYRRSGCPAATGARLCRNRKAKSARSLS